MGTEEVCWKITSCPDLVNPAGSESSSPKTWQILAVSFCQADGALC